MVKLITVALFMISITGCDRSPNKRQYIKTERGLIIYARGYCELGLLISNESINILDENGNPITCSGYISLTDKEAKSFKG